MVALYPLVRQECLDVEQLPLGHCDKNLVVS